MRLWNWIQKKQSNQKCEHIAKGNYITFIYVNYVLRTTDFRFKPEKLYQFSDEHRCPQ